MVANQGTTQQTRDTQASLVAQLSATVRADEAAVDAARVNLGYATIRSPIDGRVGLRQVDQGNVVRAADPGGIVVVAQLRPIAVVFTLPEQFLARLPRPATNLPVLALARDGDGVIAEGTLAVIDNQIDATTGTIRLKAVFPNEDLRLWPGQFVNARLVSEVRSNAIVVPASVVQRGPDWPFAFVIRTNVTVEPRAIRVGQTDRGEAIIEDGLKAGERVVVDGQYRLQSGSTVRAAERGGTNAPKSGGRRAP